MVSVARWGLAVAVLAVAGCDAAPKRRPAPPEVEEMARTASYREGAPQVRRAVIAALQGLGEKIEQDRADGRYVQSATGERPDRSWVRTRVWISGQANGVTRVTVKRSVVKRVGGHEVEWTSLPILPEAGDEVLHALDRRLHRAPDTVR